MNDQLSERAGGVELRPATTWDLAFVDALQKKASKSLGFMTRGTLEGKVALGEVLMAETPGVGGQPLGYIIGSDRYYKREDVGVIYQVNVTQTRRRGLVGAALVRAMLARWPWGVRLACCWCAQDLEVNRFWQALGFVPLAYRGGSTRKQRTHVFWQRRVHRGDDCPWWYPSQTTGGSIREDRLVLPIPPDQHWSQARPVLLPGMRDAKQIEADAKSAKPALGRTKVVKPPEVDCGGIASGGFRFAPSTAPPPEAVAAASPKPTKKPAAKNDPALVRKVRTLRDVYLAEVNAGGIALPEAGKYDVAKALPSGADSGETARLPAPPPRQLPAAA